jgi:F-box/leucine-rich repeat protein 10/11
MPEKLRFCPSYLLLSQDGAITMSHIDYSATCVFYYLLRGRKTFNFAPPTPNNLELFAQFLKARRADPNILFESHAKLDGRFQKIVLRQNEAICIPLNVIHSVLTDGDSMAIAFNFIHKKGIFPACQAYCNERIAGENYDDCYPNFKELAVASMMRRMTT